MELKTNDEVLIEFTPPFAMAGSRARRVRHRARLQLRIEFVLDTKEDQEQTEKFADCCAWPPATPQNNLDRKSLRNSGGYLGASYAPNQNAFPCGRGTPSLSVDGIATTNGLFAAPLPLHRAGTRGVQ